MMAQAVGIPLVVFFFAVCLAGAYIMIKRSKS